MSSERAIAGGCGGYIAGGRLIRLGNRPVDLAPLDPPEYPAGFIVAFASDGDALFGVIAGAYDDPDGAGDVWLIRDTLGAEHLVRAGHAPVLDRERLEDLGAVDTVALTVGTVDVVDLLGYVRCESCGSLHEASSAGGYCCPAAE